MKRTVFLLAALALALGSSAKVVLPKVLGSNMVLQQQSEANLWGKADPDKKITVTVSWSDDKVRTRSDKDGNWAVNMRILSFMALPRLMKVIEFSTGWC